MSEQERILSEVVCREVRSEKNLTPKTGPHRALPRLMLGVVFGATTRALYGTIVLSDPFDFLSLTTAIASAVVILCFWHRLVPWLAESTTWWAQLLLGFSVGFLGQTTLRELVEVIK